MRFDPQEGIGHLLLHLQRIEDSARAFGFAFNRHDIRNELQTAVFPLRQSARVRLLLSPSGAVALETTPLPPAAAGTVEAALVPSSEARRGGQECVGTERMRWLP